MKDMCCPKAWHRAGHSDWCKARPTPQSSATVVACKAPEWCGRTDPMHKKTNWCSRDCQFSKLPPLAAQPAEELGQLGRVAMF